MAPTRRAVLGSVAASFALAGCLTGNDGSSPTPESSPADGGATPTPTGDGGMAATVRVRSHAEYGDILVGPDGLTLYMFDQDTNGSGESACHDSCASAWPPLTVDGSPTAGDGVTAELGTFQRSGGSTQVTAAGWPLYYYASDSEPGDATGQGVSGVWWVLGPGGEPKRGSGTATPTATPTASGGGSGGDGGGGSGDGGGGGYY